MLWAVISAGHCAKGVPWSISLPPSIGFCYETPSSPQPLKPENLVIPLGYKSDLGGMASCERSSCMPRSLFFFQLVWSWEILPTSNAHPLPYSVIPIVQLQNKTKQNTYDLSSLYFHRHKHCLLNKENSLGV